MSVDLNKPLDEMTDDELRELYQQKNAGASPKAAAAPIEKKSVAPSPDDEEHTDAKVQAPPVKPAAKYSHEAIPSRSQPFEEPGRPISTTGGLARGAPISSTAGAGVYPGGQDRLFTDEGMLQPPKILREPVMPGDVKRWLGRSPSGEETAPEQVLRGGANAVRSAGEFAYSMPAFLAQAPMHAAQPVQTAYGMTAQPTVDMAQQMYKKGIIESLTQDPLMPVKAALPVLAGVHAYQKMTAPIPPEAAAAAPQQASPQSVPLLPPAAEPEPIQAYPYTPEPPPQAPPPVPLLPPGEQQAGPPQLPPGEGNYDQTGNRPPVIEVPRGGFDGQPDQPNRPGFAEALRKRRQKVGQYERQQAADARDQAWRGKGYTGTENLDRRVPGQVEQAPEQPGEMEQLKAKVADLEARVKQQEAPPAQAPAAPAGEEPLHIDENTPEPEAPAPPPKKTLPMRRAAPAARPSPNEVSASEATDEAPNPNKGPTTSINQAIQEQGPFPKAPAKTGAVPVARDSAPTPGRITELKPYLEGRRHAIEGTKPQSENPQYLAGYEDQVLQEHLEKKRSERPRK